MDSIVDLRMHMDRSPYTINEVHNPFKNIEPTFAERRTLEQNINAELSTLM